VTKEKLKSLFQFYFQRLSEERKRRHAFSSMFPGSELYIDPRQFSEYEADQHFINSPWSELAHLRFMCVEAQKFVDIEKAMRWLGFLQGVLWSRGFYSLNDLKNHSRPETELSNDR